MDIILSILPVLVFLIFLFLLDSFKLVVKKILLVALLWGSLSALIVYMLQISHPVLAPVIEEAIKAVFILYIIYKNKVGFMVDAAVYGFAAGAGFALVENLFYLNALGDASILTWIIRGFGTALMHGGCTALVAVIIISGKSRGKKMSLYLILAFFVAFLIHFAFNLFYIKPLYQTLGIIVLLPVVFILIFSHSEHQLHNWLEIEFSSEVELLNMMNKGEMLNTKAGKYLSSLRSNFSGESILDMYCYISLYLELSIKAKRNLMLKENDFPLIQENGIDGKLTELKELKKRIGKVGEFTLSPLIRMNYRDLWKLNLLK